MDFAGVDFQIDVVVGPQLAKYLGDAAHFD